MSNQNKKVVYTAIFGGYDTLQEPQVDLPEWDFICFTEQSLRSERWEIKQIRPPIDGDSVRSARKVKILPHEYLSEYDISVWVDGNIVIRGNLNELVANQLQEHSFAAYTHRDTDPTGREGIYEEAAALIRMTKAGKYKDDPKIIRKQVRAYRQEGYPEKNGLLMTSVLLRRHNDPTLKEVMNDWWHEVKNKSRRDQLSFNYVAWKHNFDYKAIEDDGWNNEYFKRVYHYVPWYKKPKLYFDYVTKRIKHFMYGEESTSN